MPETLAALLFAHMLADFVLQTDRMVANKARAGTMLAHGAVVFATLLACMGSLSPALWFLALAHVGVDLVKTHSGRRGLAAFLADQAAHLALIAAVAALTPDLWSRGLWAGAPALPALMAATAGAILAVRGGGFALELLIQYQNQRHATQTTSQLAQTLRTAALPATAAPTADPGLPGGGEMIGLLERGLIFVLMLSGQAGGIGFLIAAKSILRFDSVSKDRAAAEYVIIGTLASFLWAIATGAATLRLLDALPPLQAP